MRESTATIVILAAPVAPPAVDARPYTGYTRCDRDNPAGPIMRRRAFIKTLLILALLLAASFGIVGSLLKQEPEFYVRENADGLRADDSAQAGKVVTRISELIDRKSVV